MIIYYSNLRAVIVTNNRSDALWKSCVETHPLINIKETHTSFVRT